MSIWVLLVAIFVAGVVGGVVNAFLSDNGFVLPRKTGGIMQPGGLGNAFIGGVAAVISWGLYGPFAGAPVFSGQSAPSASFTLSALVGAILVGVSGARWLSNEVDKQLLRAAGIKAARRPSNLDLATKFTTASPADALIAASAVSAEPQGHDKP